MAQFMNQLKKHDFNWQGRFTRKKNFSRFLMGVSFIFKLMYCNQKFSFIYIDISYDFNYLYSDI